MTPEMQAYNAACRLTMLRAGSQCCMQARNAERRLTMGVIVRSRSYPSAAQASHTGPAPCSTALLSKMHACNASDRSLKMLSLCITRFTSSPCSAKSCTIFDKYTYRENRDLIHALSSLSFCSRCRRTLHKDPALDRAARHSKGLHAHHECNGLIHAFDVLLFL